MALFPQNKLLLATHNQGKIIEMKSLLKGQIKKIVSARDLNLSEPEEAEDSFSGNSLLKARSAAKESGLASLADDSGLCVNALNGDPGIHSARWAQDGGNEERDFKKAMAKVHDLLGDSKDRSAYFICVLALVLPDGQEEVFEGRVEGRIVWPMRGEGGFGYDPIFQPYGYDITFGEMEPIEKASISHRVRALQKFLNFVKEQNE